MTTQPLEKVIVKTERRHFQRRKFQGKMEMEWGSTILSGDVRDIGPGGLFVELAPPLWVGAAFRARVMLEPVLLLDCTVVRVEPGTGIAVVFEVPEESGKAQLEALLMSLSPA
jgi:PilZ domain-containing protein